MKNTLFYISGIMFLLTILSCNLIKLSEDEFYEKYGIITDDADGDGDDVYKLNLRDTGPAGGLIFYINPNAETDGWKYLEAAPQSTEWTSKRWGGYNTAVMGADGTAIGTGRQNTIDIVAQYGNIEPYLNETDYAAKLCSDLSSGGYDDWFLPSIDELNQMYENLHTQNVGGFANVSYWSSSESSATYAGYYDFYNGNQNSYSKMNEELVRAIRAF